MPTKTPKELEEKEQPDYKPKEEEQGWINFVYERKKEMEQGRTNGSGAVTDWETYWDNSDKAYNAKPPRTTSSDDWRSNLHIPLEKSMCETIKQETVDQVIKFTVEPGDETDIPKLPFMNKTIDYALEKMKWNIINFLSTHDKITRGTAVLKVIYRKEKRKVYDPVSMEEGSEEYEEKDILDYDDVFIQLKDLFDIYIDERVRSVDDARDLIERELINIREFHRLYDTMYPNAKSVKAGGDTDLKQYYSPPKDVSSNDVEVLHYWNKPLDKYIILANGVLVRNMPNPYSHKQIPYTLLYGIRTTDSIYGQSIPMQIKEIVDELNTLRNLRIDFQHMSIDKMFVVSDQLDLDEEDLTVRPHGMIPVSTTTMPIQNLIMPLEYGDIKPSSAQDIEMLLEDARRTLGIDDRVQGVMPQGRGTATEAAILKEASMKRINVMVKVSEMDGLPRLGDLLIQTIQQYYAIPKIKQIVGEDGEVTEEEEYKQVRVPESEIVPTQEGTEEIRQGEGYALFQASPDKVRGNFDVKVMVDSTPYPSKAMRQAKITEMVQTVLSNPMWQQMISAKKGLDRYLRSNDENPEDWVEEGTGEGDEQNLANQENQQMDNGEALPSTPNITEKHTVVHLERTQNADYQQLSPEIQQVYEQHIMGEQEQHQGGGVKPAQGARAPALTGPPPAPPTPNQGAEGANQMMGV